MAIRITEAFEVRAPIDEVWSFMMDPHRVVVCMPGAKLEEVVDERTFVGLITVKIGPVNARYSGRVRFTEVDEAAHTMKMQAEGREMKGGGMARASMTSTLRKVDAAVTEVVADASVDITGRIAQFGQGMVKDISHELFLQFVECAKVKLEAGPTGEPTETASGDESADNAPIPVLGLIVNALWAATKRFFRRLVGVFRRSSDGRSDSP